MKNIYLIPTKSKSILHFDHTGLFPSKNYQLSTDINSVVEGYDLHIISEDKVNPGDYFIVELFKIDGSSDGYHLEKCIDIKDDVWVNSYDITKTRHIDNCKKVVISTNEEVTNDRIQRLDHHLLEFFCINPNTEYVELERLEDVQFVDHLENGEVIEGIYENYFVRFLDTEETKKVYDDNDMIKFVNWCEDNYFSLSGKGMWCESPDFENNKVLTTKELLEKFKKIDKLL